MSGTWIPPWGSDSVCLFSLFVVDLKKRKENPPQERRLVKTRLGTAGGLTPSAAAAVRTWRNQSSVRTEKLGE